MQKFPHIAISSALLFAATLALVSFGIIGVWRVGPFNFDGQVMYAAGRAWLHGANPYNHADLTRAVAGVPGMDVSELQFFYPPQASALCILLGLFPYTIARSVWLSLNLTAIAATIVISCQLVHEETPSRWRAGAVIVAALVIGNPFTAHVVWMGQTTLIAFAATLAAWRFADRGRWFISGLCLGLASYKPQICVLVIVWLLFERNWRVLICAFGAATTLSVYSLISQSPIGALHAWRAGINSGYGMQFNLPTFPHKVGMQPLLYYCGLSIPSWMFIGISVLLTLGLWSNRKRLHSTDRLALLMAVTCTFSTYMHDYDFVALIPLYISLWRLAPPHRSVAIASAILVFLLFTPQRFVALLGDPALDHWRTLVIIALAVIIYARATSLAAPAQALHSDHRGHELT